MVHANFQPNIKAVLEKKLILLFLLFLISAATMDSPSAECSYSNALQSDHAESEI